ncbi:hypothetical protein [Nocardiopsis sp. FR6]|uniref:hypothetical protein n=1 Tax=Nocardiopsis sp. FR6 TaxID=2605986 RepID=UPI001F3453DC|nr:hypothetical protein [Nocardiopsis sp. FR6]
MSEHREPTAPARPFALLTVTTRPESTENVVGLSFHTGPTAHGTSAPEIACHTYEEQAPILTLHQGSTHVSITSAAPQGVEAADVRFAKELVTCALRYYQAIDQAHRTRDKTAHAHR